MNFINVSVRRGFLIVLLAVAGVQVGFSQTVTATVEGTVLDVQGAAIANAQVSVQNTGTNITRSVKSDGEGRYFVNTLNPGEYQITVEAVGFSKKVLKGITLNVGADARIDVPLALGQDTTTISVEAQAQTTDTQSSANGTVIDNRQVVELPLANRQFYSLALLSPAAYQPAQNSTLGFRGGFNVAGVSEISNQFTFNGIYDNDMGVAQPSFRPSVETIQEFKLLTGVYPAEYGRMSGGQLVIVEKSGTNQFHGTVYEFIRNQVTDAKPYFNAAGAKTPSFKQNTFGATVGGPIFKDKTFFFFGYEGQRIRRAVTALANVPTTAMLQGLFTEPIATKIYDPAAKNGTTLTPVSTTATTATYDFSKLAGWTSVGAQAGQTIAKLGYPAPNTTGATNYNFSETRIENMNEESLRIDHKLSAKDFFYGSWNYFRDPAFEPSNSLCSSYVVPKFGCFTDQHSTLANITWDRIFSPNLLNEVRLGFQRLVQPRIQEDQTKIGSAYPGLPGGPYFTQAGYANNQGLPNTVVTGYATIGGATNLPQDRWDNHYQIVDVVTWNHGKHTFKAGADFFLARSTNIITSSGRAALTVNDSSLANVTSGLATNGRTGDSMADLLMGIVYTSSIGTTAPTVYLNFQSTHLFLQDDWKVNPFLTLNLGIRWELDKPVYSPHSTVSNFDIAAQQFTAAGSGAGSGLVTGYSTTTQKFVTNGASSFDHLYNYDWNNFAPRVGFAWQPLKKDTTVIKGAMGIFYNTPLLYNQFLTNGTQAPFRYVPTYTSAATGIVNLANPFPSGGLAPCVVNTQHSANPGCANVLAALSIAPNYRTPYITEWSLGVQQALTKSLVLETTYFGSKGTRLPLTINLNQINLSTYNPTITATQASIPQYARPFSGYGTVNNQDTRANSEFHSWQNSLKQSYSKGITFLLAYTFSKSIDGGGGIGSGSNSSGSPQNIYNLRAERGLSDFNVAHRVVFSPMVELPFGKNKAYLTHGVGSALAGGWQISGIFSFQTGRPFTVTNSASNNSGSFGSADRPNVIADPNASVDSKTGAKTHTVSEWFNINAFQLAQGFVGYNKTTGAAAIPGQFGNAGRNIVIGPKYTELDLTLARNFPIFERVNGQFRAESFNLLNHPNFLNPLTQGVQFGTSPFGTLTQANDNREFQFSLRILY